MALLVFKIFDIYVGKRAVLLGVEAVDDPLCFFNNGTNYQEINIPCKGLICKWKNYYFAVVGIIGYKKFDYFFCVTWWLSR